MTGKTTIEWTDQPGYRGAVWNPTTGCTRVSAGCDNCYAFALHDKRHAANLKANKGLISPSTSPAALRKAGHPLLLPWPKQYDLPFSRVQLLEDRLDVPLRTRTPTCYFVDSMADLFHEDVPGDFIVRVFNTMRTAHRHRFLILTKRPDRMRSFMTSWVEEAKIWGTGDVLPNVWLGTSVEDQRSADERIPHLLATPAAVRFLSCEPLLGHVTIPFAFDDVRAGLHWVIVGGESGPRARPMDLAWARSLVEQCHSAGVAPFVKQMGSDPIEACPDGGHPGEVHDIDYRESHGRDMAEWPEDLRVREFPKQRVPA